MCVSAAPADFSGTTVFLGLKNHPVHGKIFVLGYQNTAVNLHSGPNAMLIHLPALGFDPNNMLQTQYTRNVLKDMVEAVTPRNRGSYSLGGAVAKGVTVFEHDIYHVVSASNAADIPGAMHLVPPNKRIDPNQDLYNFYGRRLSNCPVLLFCFDNRQALEAAPVMLWYKPKDLNVFSLPALDCHTGKVPNLNASVDVDHWIILGADDALRHTGNRVDYTDNVSSIRDFLPQYVIGKHYGGKMRNGDFVYPTQSVLSGSMDNMQRLLTA